MTGSTILKKIVVAAAIGLVATGWVLQRQPTEPDTPQTAARETAASDPAAEAFDRRANGILMTVKGEVERILADDRDGSAHQRFILRTSGRHTVLVAHNIDLAPRLVGLAVGERLILRGQYEWNSQGGVIHWTHHDPDGSHPGGYIERQGRRYQ